jgi:DNA polymerase phi
MASNVLPLFWHLASSSRDTRLSASADLVSAIETFQRSFVEAKAATGDIDEDEDDDDEEEDDGDESGMEVDGSDDDDEDDEEDRAVAQRLDKAFARNNAPDVVYTVKRLVRGLGSSRESSRLGFAVALTEVRYGLGGDMWRRQLC